MARGRPYEFPDPNEASPKHPSVIVESDQVLGLYNQTHEGESMKNVVGKVQEWFIEEARRHGWDEATFVRSECVLLNASVQAVYKNID